jgi:hypothetical protein
VRDQRERRLTDIRDQYASRTRRRVNETEEEKGKQNELRHQEYMKSNIEEMNELRRRQQYAAWNTDEGNELPPHQQYAASNIEERIELLHRHTDEMNELLRRQHHAASNT